MSGQQQKVESRNEVLEGYEDSEVPEIIGMVCVSCTSAWGLSVQTPGYFQQSLRDKEVEILVGLELELCAPDYFASALSRY